MFKFRIKATDCFLSYSKSANPYGPTIPQVILTTIDGRSWTIDWEMLTSLIEPIDGDAQVFWDGLKAQLSPPTQEELVGMRMIPDDNGGFTMRNITKPKGEL